MVGALLIPIVLLINHAGGIAFALFVAAVAGLGTNEFYRMFRESPAPPSALVGVLGSVCVCFSFNSSSSQAPGLVLTGVVALILVEKLARQEREVFVAGVGTTLLGVVYVGWLMGYFILLRNSGHGLEGWAGGEFGGVGKRFVYFLLVLTWSYDTVAYVVGSFLGRRKIFSNISPAKTAEGVVGGLVGCVIAAVTCQSTFASFLRPGEAVLAGITVGIAAQAGDLIESIIKRSMGTKDSSNMLPGHGGILDRFDSLLITGPVFYFYLRLLQVWNNS